MLILGIIFFLKCFPRNESTNELFESFFVATYLVLFNSSFRTMKCIFITTGIMWSWLSYHCLNKKIKNSIIIYITVFNFIIYVLLFRLWRRRRSRRTRRRRRRWRRSRRWRRVLHILFSHGYRFLSRKLLQFENESYLFIYSNN